jgi:hypothetical protein
MPQTQLNDTTPELDPYVTCMTSPDAPGVILMAGAYHPPPSVSKLRLWWYDVMEDTLLA